MNNWFECKVSYEKILENGMQKKVIEPYLVDALSFTEAEARIIDELKPFITGEFVIADIKRARLSELFFNPEGDRYFRAKVNFITLDEKSGSEKRKSVNILAQASDIEEALDVVKKGMIGTMADYEISSLAETTLMDVFRYSKERERKVFSSANIKVEFNPKDGKDDLFNEAVDLVMRSKEASISQMQRYFSIGINRATKIMNQLEEAGIVGKENESLKRDILIPK